METNRIEMPWFRTLLLAAIAVAASIVLGWVLTQQSDGTLEAGAAAADDPTVLDDDGRFTGPGEVWPPQPRDATDIVVRDDGGLTAQGQEANLRTAAQGDEQLDAPVDVASADGSVQAAIGSDHNLIAAETSDGTTELVYYSLSTNQTVAVIVEAGTVAAVDTYAPTEYQPELSVAEKQAAVEIARAHWESRGDARIGSLQGYSILAFQPGGAHYETRMVYVSFHVDEDARPELLAWVDLVTGDVVKGEVGPMSTSTETGQPERGTSLVARTLSILAVTAIAFVSLIATTTPAADAATTFRGWEFTPQVSSTRSDGLALNDVSYNGVRIFERISLPAMNVFYDNNVCGPYVDRIGGSRYDYEPPTEFTQNGVRWLSIGLTDQIGAYVITQMFYLSENGEFDAHIFSKGLQCNTRHDHVPFWRIDFDVAAGGNDEIRRQTAAGMQPMTTEFSMSATAAVDHGWEVHDTVTGDYVTIDFDDGTFGLGGDTVVPETDYVENQVHGRQYRSSETRWQGGATYGLFGNNGEAITDAVLWYSGWLPHSPEEGPSLWHSTGIRMQVNEAAAEQSSIAGAVRYPDGSGVGGAQVDLFNEDRTQFIDATTTAGNGSYSFGDLAPGCYVLTFVAPDGTSFNGNRYQNRAVCVAAGQTSSGNDATVVAEGGGQASVGDSVTFSDGSPAAGVQIDLFSENRQSWLGATTTDASGSYRFDLAQPMCGVVTFIAPPGETFVSTGGRYTNRSFCAGAGENLTDIDATLVSTGSFGTLGDRVTEAGDGSGVGGVKIVLYEANGDGSRGSWIRDTTTDGSGTYRFEVAGGCYVLDFVAPAGRTWTGTAGQYLQRFGCVAAGGTNADLDGVLS